MTQQPAVPPPMPSILASVVAETWEVIALGRRTLALLVGRL
jgi:hypothetical protein